MKEKKKTEETKKQFLPFPVRAVIMDCLSGHEDIKSSYKDFKNGKITERQFLKFVTDTLSHLNRELKKVLSDLENAE